MAIPVSAMTKLPWKQLIVLAPEVAKAAKSIWGNWASRPKPVPIDTAKSMDDQIAEVSRRLQSLEANEKGQAEVIGQMAEQLQGIATGLKETASRQTRLAWIAGAALLVSLAALLAPLLS